MPAAGAASALALPTDVADDAAVRAAFAEVAAQLGPVDAVVHSAGLVAYGRLEEVPVEIFDRVVATNLLGSVEHRPGRAAAACASATPAPWCSSAR